MKYARIKCREPITICVLLCNYPEKTVDVPTVANVMTFDIFEIV